MFVYCEEKKHTLFRSNSKINTCIIIVIITTQKAETDEKEFNQESKRENKSVFPDSSFLPFRNIESASPGVYYNFQ